MTRKAATAPAPAVDAPAPAVSVAVRLTTTPADAVLADITLAIHDTMRGFDKAQTAYDKARATMIRAAVPVVRATADLYLYAECTKDKTFIAERGVNAGKPAVQKLATHLGYERRRFDKFYNAALAVIEADVELTGDITPEDLELIAPFFTKDAERKRAERAERADKPANKPAGDAGDVDESADGDTVTAGRPAETDGGTVILADIIATLTTLDKQVSTFTSNAGLTRDTMDAIADTVGDILAKLESAVAE